MPTTSTTPRPRRKANKKQRAKRDLYAETTQRIIDKLESGVVPWRCPWSRHRGPAQNIVSGTVYRGVNSFLLNFAFPRSNPYYLSFKQAKELGGRIRKGAKAEPVVYFATSYKDADGKSVKPEVAEQLQRSGHKLQCYPFLKYYNVFNVEDVEGATFDLPEVPTFEHDPIEAAEAVMESVTNGPQIIEHPNQCFYRPRTDELAMTPCDRFTSAEGYYATLFHELTHATGHASRLGRREVTQAVTLGDPNYAREELTAEMGAAFLCSQTGISAATIENSAAYIDNWLQALEHDHTLVFKAAAAAQRAVDWINGER